MFKNTPVNVRGLSPRLRYILGLVIIATYDKSL